jgi:hypothetical protein
MTDDENCFPAESEPALRWENGFPSAAIEKRRVGYSGRRQQSSVCQHQKVICPFRENVCSGFCRPEQRESAITILNKLQSFSRKETAEFFVELSAHKRTTWSMIYKRTDYAEATDDVLEFAY